MIDMVAYVKKVPHAGETVIGDSFALGFGGKGANQAVMARRLNATVSMVNTLGDDVFGDTTLTNFQEQIVIGQLEIPQEVTLEAFKTAHKYGAITILNPAPFAPISQELIGECDWIIPNESEFAGMHPQGLEPTSDQVILELSATLKTRFAVTLGDKGAAFTTQDGKVHRVSAPSVTAIDSTGAGDAFVGAFAVGLALGLAEERAIALGCACASDSVTRLGTQSSYPTPAQAQEILKRIP